MKNLDFEVLFSKDFRLQLSELAFYVSYKLSDPTAARKLYYKLVNSAKSLKDFPDRHPAIDIKKSTEDVLRKFVVGKYLITYYVDHKNKIVYINNLLTSK